MVEYTRAGDWVPGEQNVGLEFLGKLYGYVVAVPVTAVAFGAVWVAQRPSRAFGALVVGALLVGLAVFRG